METMGKYEHLSAVDNVERERLVASLAECFRLSGADPDGNEDWRLAEHAVAEVKRMREDWDLAEEASDLAATEVKELRALIEQLSAELIAKEAEASRLDSELLVAQNQLLDRDDEIERLRKLPDLVPTNWLDPLLTGPTAVLHGFQYSPTDIERLVWAVKKRLLDALAASANGPAAGDGKGVGGEG